MSTSARETAVVDIYNQISSIAKTEGYSVIDSHPDYNDRLDFDEGSGELTATLTRGLYSGEELASHIQTQMNSVGSHAYTVSYSTSTRKFTITDGTDTVSLLFSSGTSSSRSCGSLLGFSGDQSAASQHVGSATNGFNFDIGDVGRELKEFNEPKRYPAVYVTSAGAENVPPYHDQSEFETVRMIVLVDGYTKTISRANKDTQLNQLYSDLVKAVLNDPSRGGVANYTKLLSVATDMGILNDYGWLNLQFEIEVEFDILNP